MGMGQLDLEPATDSTPTDLGDFFTEELGVPDPRGHSGLRIERPSASEFGVDDRVTVTRSQGDEGEQSVLFTGVDENQRTLDGETAGQRWPFGCSPMDGERR